MQDHLPKAVLGLLLLILWVNIVNIQMIWEDMELKLRWEVPIRLKEYIQIKRKIMTNSEKRRKSCQIWRRVAIMKQCRIKQLNLEVDLHLTLMNTWRLNNYQWSREEVAFMLKMWPTLTFWEIKIQMAKIKNKWNLALSILPNILQEIQVCNIINHNHQLLKLSSRTLLRWKIKTH